jgi:peroxiredoxin
MNLKRTAKSQMVKMRFLFSFFILLFSFSSFAATIIECNNSDYAGAKLIFYTYTDPVSLTQKEVFTLKIDDTGKSTISIETKTTDYVFCDFGIYRGMLLIEPNQTIQLQLPPKREKSFADQKNPYFVPVSFWFATEDNNQLNNQISKFTFVLNRLTDQYFNQLYFRQLDSYFDSLQYLIEKDFGNIQSEPFLFHKKYSIKLVEADAFRLKPENISAVFSSAKQQYYTYPAFTTLFEKTFNGLLSFEAKSVKGSDVKKATNHGDISFLTNYVQTKYKLQGEILDLALLKMLHDAYYSGDFTKSSIEQMINSQRFAKNQSKLIRETAKNTFDKITFLQKGSTAPNICLKNNKGINVCSNAKKDKFKYLVFADIEILICREQLKYLPVIQERFEKYLEIFVILRNTNPEEIKKFFSENEVPGTILTDENNEFINLYKVKSFPQCYLLDENHKVTLSTTQAPLDGFEQQFGTYLRQELFERQRNQ